MVSSGGGLRAAGVVAVLAVVGAGCTQNVDGRAVKETPPLVVGVAEVEGLVGAQLANTTADRVPPEPVTVDPADCAVAAGPSTTAVYTSGWTQYHLVTMQEAADRWDHSVTQTAGKYPDDAGATNVFSALTADLQTCSRATATDALDDSTAEWTFTVETPGPDTTRWTATQVDTDGWACYREARRTGAWVVQTAVCQVGNGAPAAADLLDRLAENVAGT
ncbi:sensor domain-containing protein [Mycobacterium sp. 1274756.6]|uniref:sensor domain-containing protein n=1 Tax=Mycobacterium sp. 1274756.6 TaxID=1834076 RepID=UPI0012E903BB|nr:sensor domain-containing protein [Mycobacterium sp. 1274756.6]